MLVGRGLHGPCHFRQHAHLDQRAQAPDQVGQFRHLVGRRQPGPVLVEAVPFHQPHHVLGCRFDVAAQLAHHRQHVVERDAGVHQFRGSVQHARARGAELGALLLEDAQVGGVHQPARREVAAEHLHQLDQRVGLGRLVGPRRGHRVAESHQVGDVVALGQGLEQIADAGQRVAALEHLRDDAQPTQVLLAVDRLAPLLLGRRDQSAILVGADVAHVGAGRAGQRRDRVGRRLAAAARHAGTGRGHAGIGLGGLPRAGAHGRNHTAPRHRANAGTIGTIHYLMMFTSFDVDIGALR